MAADFRPWKLVERRVHELYQESFSPPYPPHTVHACRGLILKDLWAEIFFASGSAAATLIVKTEQVTIRIRKEEEDGTEERGRGHKASRRFKIPDGRADRKAEMVFWSANHRCFVLYVLLLSSLRDVDKQFKEFRTELGKYVWSWMISIINEGPSSFFLQI